MPAAPKQSRREQSHERILDAAARAVRAKGFAGVGVADVMKEAGLTHGGFYAHFESRDALLAEAVEHAAMQSSKNVRERMRLRVEAGESEFRALVEEYLSEEHMDAQELGCPVAALVSEMPRLEAELRAGAARRVREMLDRVGRALPPGAPSIAAASVASTLIGALQLARTLGREGGGYDVLRACRETLITQYDRSGRPA